MHALEKRGKKRDRPKTNLTVPFRDQLISVVIRFWDFSEIFLLL